MRSLPVESLERTPDGATIYALHLLTDESPEDVARSLGWRPGTYVVVPFADLALTLLKRIPIGVEVGRPLDDARAQALDES